MEINESCILYDAPPVAHEFNNNNISLNKKNTYKIIRCNDFIISSKIKNIIEDKSLNLKISLKNEDFKKIRKAILVDIINFIQSYCDVKLLSNNLNYKNEFFDINKRVYNNFYYSLDINFDAIQKSKELQFKDIKYDIVQKETGTEFYCSNHKRYFKTKMAFDSHYRATHKFKCNICGLFLGFKKKLDKHITNIHKNNINNFINQIFDEGKKINIKESMNKIDNIELNQK